MKKLLALDKINIGIIILNIIGFFVFICFGGNTGSGFNNIFGNIILALMMYVVFGIPLILLIAIILNIVSILKKKNQSIDMKFNLILFIILILNFPIWYKFFWISLMGI